MISCWRRTPIMKPVTGDLSGIVMRPGYLPMEFERVARSEAPWMRQDTAT